MITVRRSLVLVAIVALIAGLVGWGILAHRDAPRWIVGEKLTRTQATEVLRDSVADLDSAALVVNITGDTNFDLEGAVDLASPKLRAGLRFSKAGLPQPTEVRIIGSKAWIQIDPEGPWARTKLHSNASGWAQTVLAQVAGGINLRHLFDGASLGVRKMTYSRDFEQGGVTGDILSFTINAHAVRDLLPHLLTQKSDEIASRAKAAVWLDKEGKLVRFETRMNGEAVAVTVTSRNPQVKVRAPRGKTVPLATILPAENPSATVQPGATAVNATGQ